MDSRKAWRMDIAERTNRIAPQVKQKKSSRTNSIFQQVKQKKSSRTNNIKTSIRK